MTDTHRPNSTRLDEIVLAYDIRGTVPEQLDAEIAHPLGVAFAAFTKASHLIIAHDMRPSAPELVDAFAAGVMEQGVDVVHLGLASTDLMYFASGKLDAPGAMFTASHNPAQYNGIKLCLAGARPVGEDSGLQEIKAMAAEGLEPVGTKGTVTQQALIEDYAAHVRSFVDTKALRPLKVVADTANGMGGLVVP